MAATDLPAALQNERVLCAVLAAQRYRIPAAILLAVSEKENGRPGMVNKNRNGTSDIGTMQFNSAYIATLAPHGITPADVAASGCYPYHLAAWRLRRHILLDSGDIWTRAANYHSYTPERNAIYRADLMNKAAVWAQKLAPVTSGIQSAIASAVRNADRMEIKQPEAATSGRSMQLNADRYIQRSITIASDIDYGRLGAYHRHPAHR